MGNLPSTTLFPPAPHWTPDKMPDQTGRVIIVTGGNTGIGYQTCKELLKKNAKVYLAARSPSKAQEAIQQLKSETGREAIFLRLDLADLKAIRTAAEEFLSKERELHVLFNSGGVMAPGAHLLTADGYDIQFGTNTLGHFFFTKLLLPALLAPSPAGRVINTSSSAQGGAPSGAIKWETLKGPKTGGLWTNWKLYSQSKLGNIIISNELARRYGDKGLVSISLDPGNIRTDLQRHQSGFFMLLVGWMLYPAPYGAITQLYAGTAPEAASLNGKYLIPWAREGQPRSDARDHEIGQKLWDWCEEQVKDF